MAAKVVLDPLKLMPGTALLAPLISPSGVLLTTVVSGAVEHDADVFYVTPDGASIGGRAAVQASHIACQNASSALVNGTGAQRMFSTPTTGALTVAGNTTYLIEGLVGILVGTGLAANLISFGGNATVFSVMYRTDIVDSAGSGAASIAALTTFFTTMAGGAMDAANTSASSNIAITGVIRVNAGGTVIPQIAFSAAPGGTPIVTANSYIRFTPIGNGTVNQIGAWA